MGALAVIREGEKIRQVELGDPFLVDPVMCEHCGAPLTSDVLLNQATKLMKPFEGRRFDAALKAEIREMLDRVTGPLNTGRNCCYSCADAVHRTGAVYKA